jgi:hypothetical protein
MPHADGETSENARVAAGKDALLIAFPAVFAHEKSTKRWFSIR